MSEAQTKAISVKMFASLGSDLSRVTTAQVDQVSRLSNGVERSFEVNKDTSYICLHKMLRADISNVF